MSLRTVNGYATPSIHLNGTAATTLKEEYTAAYDAIDKAIDALVDATCNGRDFYPQGPDAYYTARNERMAALEKLREAQHYAGSVLMGICDQM